MAILFFATTVAFTGVVLWQMREDSKQNNLAQTETSETSQDELSVDNNQTEEGSLEGTKLADFTPTATVDSLQKIDLQEGTGPEVQPGATITAHYTGAVAADGTIFQSSLDRGEPIQFSLGGVIKGWTDGVPGMKVGGKRRLIIPADQAYGANPPAGSGIPANAPLVFDIELVSIDE